MSHVYFMCAPGRIKIGVSKNVGRRMREIGKLSPAGECILLGVVRGGYKLEKLIHGHLADHRLHGEWFEDADDVYACYWNLKKRGPEYFGWSADEEEKVDFKPAPIKQTQRIAALNLALKMMWGENYPTILASFAQMPKKKTDRWLAGAEIPRLQRAALTSELLDWIL